MAKEPTLEGATTFSITINKSRHRKMTLSIMTLDTECCYAECHKEALNAECRYAKCNYAECRGATQTSD
jgi:hypothetical protein